MKMQEEDKFSNNNDNDDLEIVLVKIGGSSITDKSQRETLNEQGLKWFSQTLGKTVGQRFLTTTTTTTSSTTTTTTTTVKCTNNAKEAAPAGNHDNDDDNDDDDGETETQSTNPSYTKKQQQQQKRDIGFIVIHGAGSFGHFQAKEYGLKGLPPPPPPPPPSKVLSTMDECTTTPPPSSNTTTTTDTGVRSHPSTRTINQFEMQGVAETRRSVQKLNQLVVSSLIEDGSINAIGISPGFGIIPQIIPSVSSSQQKRHEAQQRPPTYNKEDEEHDDDHKNYNNYHPFLSDHSVTLLKTVIHDTLRAGLIPVLHGDVCLYQHDETAATNTPPSMAPPPPNAVILSGDVLMEVLGGTSVSQPPSQATIQAEKQSSSSSSSSSTSHNNNNNNNNSINDDDDNDTSSLCISRSIFITDVDGVFTKDPRVDDQAELVRQIWVDRHTGDLFPITTINNDNTPMTTFSATTTTTTTTTSSATPFESSSSSSEAVIASGSSHAHDVTGGLKTKLKSAATIAQSGKTVTIVKCESISAEQALRGDGKGVMIGTVLSPTRLPRN